MQQTGERGSAVNHRSRRRRDRRRGIGDVLARLGRVLGTRADPGQLRATFEEALQQVLPVRTISLRDRSARWQPERADEGRAETVAFEVPGATPAQRGVLEANFDPLNRLAEWDFQVMGHAAQLAALVLEAERARAQLRSDSAGSGVARAGEAAAFIGTSPAMAALLQRVDRIASTDFTVLIEGESGVGKELVARRVHQSSPRRTGPFVAINCAALVETLLEAELFGIEERTATGVRGRRGKFESADGGTLFLDEVSDLSLSAQAKLLRAIQDLAVERVGGTGTQRVDIRIIAATNRRLSDMVTRGQFRADLYYRLSGVDVHVPPLRERRTDISELATHFLERHRHVRALRLSDAAREALLLHDWPGNVRELQRVIERAIALAAGEVIDLDDLPPAVRGEYDAVLGPSLRSADTMRAWGSRYARLTLDRCRGNKRQTARVLGITYHTLNSYLRFPLTAAGECVRSEDETTVSQSDVEEEEDVEAIAATP
ncbi:MAG: sigma 54-interacting transcriptional regulator [Vicinamibacterales bacterium]